MGYFDVDKSAENPAPRAGTLPGSGFGATAEYQASGLPWLTASVVSSTAVSGFGFQTISKYVQVINNSSAGTFLRVGFTEAGTNLGNYVLIDGGKDVRFDMRINAIYLKGHTTAVSCSVVAGLTSIASREMPMLTGSAAVAPGGFTWAGVG